MLPTRKVFSPLLHQLPTFVRDIRGRVGTYSKLLSRKDTPKGIPNWKSEKRSGKSTSFLEDYKINQASTHVSDALRQAISGFLPKPNVYQASSLIARAGREGQLQLAFAIFDKLTAHAKPNLVVLRALLSVCKQHGTAEEVQKVFGYMEQYRIAPDIICWTILLTAYKQANNPNQVTKLFTQMQLSGIKPDMVCWTTLLCAYANAGYTDKVEEVVDNMKKCGMVLDIVCWNALLTAYANAKDTVKVDGVLAQMKASGLKPDIFSWTALLSLHAQSGNISKAEQVFSKMWWSGVKPTVVSWNALMVAYVQARQLDAAQRILDRMRKHGSAPDNASFVILLNGFAQALHIDKAQKLFDQMDQHGVVPDVRSWASLLDAYARVGNAATTHHLFNTMKQRDILPNVVSWTILISAYGVHGDAKSALQLLDEMQRSGIKPNELTFTAVLTACSHAGLADEALSQYTSMKAQFNITPRMEHEVCVLDAIGRAGKLDDAETFLRGLEQPCGVHWKTLLGSCRKWGNTKMAEWAAHNALQLEPHDPATYILLSNVYAATGEFAKSAAIRQYMKDNNIKKKPGISWIEHNGQMHEFVVDDNLHPMIEEIRKEVHKMFAEIRQAGYTPDTSYVLHDVAEEEKEHKLCFHSEKLAIAFGMLVKPAGHPLKLFKNLRVCGDCHTATKWIAKVRNREIWVRDANRWHIMSQGKCSCGDYW